MKHLIEIWDYLAGMINSMVEGCNSSLKTAKIRPMGHLEIMQIFCSFASGWNNLNRWIFKGDLFFKKPLCFLWLFQTCAGLYHVRVMDHEQLTLCSISVILHSRQSSGNLSYSGKTKCGPCRYPQRLQSVFRIHCHDSKATVPKVPLEAPWRGQGLEPSGARKPSQSWRHWLGFEHCSLFDCTDFLFTVQPQPEGRAVGRKKMEFLKNLVADQCDWPHSVPGSNQSSWLLEI